MLEVWPRPERLLPTRLVEAMSAAQSGHSKQALKLLRKSDAQDELTDDVARLVRGLAALESGAQEEARRILQTLLHNGDASLALVATLALTELHVRARRYTSAAPLLARARRHSHEDAAQLLLDSATIRLELLRRGHVDPAQVAKLPVRLQRRHPAAVHATVHLLRAEDAMLQGDLVQAAESERAARPYVHSAGEARLQRQHRDLVTLLDETVFAEVEDWQRPRRPLTRGEVADLETEAWEVWLDFLHLSLRTRLQGDPTPMTLHFAGVPDLWETLGAVARAPRRRLTWAQAGQELDLPTDGAARELVDRLCSFLEKHGRAALLQHSNSGYAMSKARFVHLYRTKQIPATQQRLLAVLAEHPGARTSELQQRLQTPQRTLVRHLSHLRQSGFVRLVGGGREARYYLV